MYVCSFIVNKGICVAKYMCMCCDVEVDDEGGKYPLRSEICTYVCFIVYAYVEVYVCMVFHRIYICTCVYMYSRLQIGRH